MLIFRLAVLSEDCGLGHLAVQFATKIGADVTVVTTSPDKQKDAHGFGRFQHTEIHRRIQKRIGNRWMT